MKRRKFITNSTFAMAAMSAPLGLKAMSFPSATLNASQQEMLEAFQQSLKGHTSPAKVLTRLGTVASVEYADDTVFCYRSLCGARLELRREGQRVITRVLA